jgi:hypothetical protein
MLGLLVTVLVWVAWIAIVTAIPTNIGLPAHIVAILMGPIAGIMVYIQAMKK